MIRTLRDVAFICTLVLLTGCASTKDIIVQEVKIQVPVPCNIVTPTKPSMPYTDTPLTEDLFTDTQKALAEIEVRKGYEKELEAAIQACNDK